MRKLTDVLSVINKKKPLNTERIILLKEYYISMYRYYMLKLYDVGYIDDPTVYNEEVIRANIMDLDIKGLIRPYGNLSLDSLSVQYALHKNKDEKQQEFLKMLYNVLLYREYNNHIDLFYECYGDSIKLGVKLIKSMLTTTTGFPLDKACIRILTDFENTVDYVSIDDYELRKILEYLEIPQEDYCIDSNLTLEDMKPLIPLLFGKHPPLELDGPYAERVFNWFETHNRTIESHFYSHNTNEVIEQIMGAVEEAEKCGDLLAVYKDRVYYSRKPHCKKYPLGFFSIIGGYNGDALFENTDQVNGYVGEGYSMEYLEEEGESYIGIPISVNGLYLYDREQTQIQSESWFKTNSINFQFDDYTLEGVEINTAELAKQSSKQGVLGIVKLNEIEQ